MDEHMQAKCEALLAALYSVEFMLEERERNIGLDEREEATLLEVRAAINECNKAP